MTYRWPLRHFAPRHEPAPQWDSPLDAAADVLACMAGAHGMDSLASLGVQDVLFMQQEPFQSGLVFRDEHVCGVSEGRVSTA